jgi:hypothetical protein
MTPFEMAQKYYPKLWDINRIQALTVAVKLTPEEYKQITGEDYAAPTTT